MFSNTHNNGNIIFFLRTRTVYHYPTHLRWEEIKLQLLTITLANNLCFTYFSFKMTNLSLIQHRSNDNISGYFHLFPYSSHTSSLIFALTTHIFLESPFLLTILDQLFFHIFCLPPSLMTGFCSYLPF